MSSIVVWTWDRGDALGTQKYGSTRVTALCQARTDLLRIEMQPVISALGSIKTQLLFKLSTIGLKYNLQLPGVMKLKLASMLLVTLTVLVHRL